MMSIIKAYLHINTTSGKTQKKEEGGAIYRKLLDNFQQMNIMLLTAISLYLAS